MSVQAEVLATVQRLCARRGGVSFAPNEVVHALPHLNPSTVRTHIVSRCCVNAPANHAHRWSYFRRTRRGEYELEPAYRVKSRAALRDQSRAAARRTASDETAVTTRMRDTVHAVITKDGEWYVADCVEIAVVTQGRSLDETVANLREAIALHLEGEEAASLEMTSSPRLVATLDLRPADAAA